MRARLAVLALLLFTVSYIHADGTAASQRAQINDERGFVAEKAYQFDGIDSVNLFNGNLTLTLPLGGTYPVSSNLAYGLKLYYNSKVWETVLGGQNTCYAGQPDSYAAFPAGYPHYGTSAGLGWTFTLGHVVAPTAGSTHSTHVYVSPDGAKHEFTALQTLPNVPGYLKVGYADDGMHLRLRTMVNGQYELEFPDGTVHIFDSAGFLTTMRDRFNNSVAISYTMDNGTRVVTMTDAHRTQTIRFHDAWTNLNVQNRFQSLRWIVESIDLAAFSPQGGGTEVGRYEFDYTYPDIARGSASGAAYSPCASTVGVPLLQRVRWVPDGSSHQFQYNVTVGLEGQQGTLRRVVLPTGGAIEWAYGHYTLPGNGCWNPFGGSDWRNHTVGVRTKTVFDAANALVGQWTYSPALSVAIETEGVCDSVEPPGGGQPVPVTHYGHQEMTNTVTDPLGQVTVNYFATWNNDYIAIDGNLERDYGLPFTRETTAIGAPETRHLSRQVCAAGTGGGNATACSPVHTTYVRYDDFSFRPRLNANHVVFNDDPETPPGAPKHYVDTAYTNYDGLGHHRKTEISSTFGPTRTFFTDYNGTSGAATLPVSAPWLPNRYTHKTVSETIGGTLTKSESRVCIDATTGALLGTRQLKGAALAPSDVMVRYGYDSVGNAVSEDWYGGDHTGIGSDDLCVHNSGGVGTSEYSLAHTYNAGLRSSTQYRSATFKSLDMTVDTRTGLAASDRDSAGAAVNYKYDKLSRVLEARPADAVWTQYTYDIDGSQPVGNVPGSPPSVVVRTFAANVTDPDPATSLTERRIYYDALGRMQQTRDRMPGGWSAVNHIYDAAGQRIKTSMPELRTGAAFEVFTPAHVTTFTFDRLGRITNVETPDGKSSSTSYIGSRRVDRTVEIGGVDSTTREDYDAHGRLLALTENAAVSGQSIKTQYAYDVGNRLTSVSTTAGGVTQTRSFVYDQRGFLTSETHPEKGVDGGGTVIYAAYDSRGHATRKYDGIVGSYDLKLTYDSAERLELVEEVDQFGQTRPLKAFAYASANSPESCVPGSSCNAQNGKLRWAKRYNYLADLGAVPVTETYTYGGPGGRPTKRDTTVENASAFAGASFVLEQTWNSSGLLASVTYPTTSAVTQPRTVSYGYTDGMLTSVTNYAMLTYQPAGLIASITHGSGGTAVTESWTPDPHGLARPRRIQATGPNGLSWTYGDYTYDGAGNITRIGNRSFSYDPMNRLVGWKDTFPGGAYQETRRYLDSFGNYLYSDFSACSGSWSCGTSSVLPNEVDGASNHYKGETYDAAGSVVAGGKYETVDLEGGATAHWMYNYAYDRTGMMKSLTGNGRNERYIYTADDERIAIVDLASSGKTTWTLRGTDNRLLRTFTRNGTTAASPWSWTEDAVWRGGNLLASESPSGHKRYHLDHLGSPRLITDSSGARIGEPDFTPFGESWTSTEGRLQFTGHERDMPAAGLAVGRVLDYMHARYYSAATGRFLSVDPILGDPHQPQSWNRYAYVMNNPVAFIDPTGRSTHTALDGTVVAVYDDEDLGVYRHNDLSKWDRKSTLASSGEGIRKMGTTAFWDEFRAHDNKTGATLNQIAEGARIQFGMSFDGAIGALHKQSLDMDLPTVAKESRTGGLFDIKNNRNLAPFGANTGRSLQGQYASARSAGNFLAGYNAAGRVSFDTYMKMAGSLHLGKWSTFNAARVAVFGIAFGDPPWYGEIEYAGRRNAQGYKHGAH